MMNTYRKKPELWETHTAAYRPSADSMMAGCIWDFVILIIFSVVFAFIDRLGEQWRQLTYIGIGIIMAIVFLRIIIMAYRKRTTKGISKQEAKNSWKATSKTALLTILDRHAASWHEKRSKCYLDADRYLELQLSPDQRTVSPDQTTIRVGVNRAVYKRLKESSTARIYYQPETPLTFLLEEEL